MADGAYDGETVYDAVTLCCANIVPVAACQLVEASIDPNCGWHTEACHAVQNVASNFCFDLLTGQSPGEESPSNDGFVLNRPGFPGGCLV